MTRISTTHNLESSQKTIEWLGNVLYTVHPHHPTSCPQIRLTFSCIPLWVFTKVHMKDLLPSLGRLTRRFKFPSGTFQIEP